MGDTRRGPMDRKAPPKEPPKVDAFEAAADEALKDEKPGAAEHIEDQSNGDN